MRYFRQPLIVGYIVTGILIALGLTNFIHLDSLEAFSHIGVALLLFIVGLGLDPKVIKEEVPLQTHFQLEISVSSTYGTEHFNSTRLLLQEAVVSEPKG